MEYGSSAPGTVAETPKVSASVVALLVKDRSSAGVMRDNLVRRVGSKSEKGDINVSHTCSFGDFKAYFESFSPEDREIRGMPRSIKDFTCVTRGHAHVESHSLNLLRRDCISRMVYSRKNKLYAAECTCDEAAKCRPPEPGEKKIIPIKKI